MKQTRHPVRNLVTRTHSLLFRATGGRFGRKLYGAPVLVLETRGRRTGKARTVPLLYIEDAGDWVVMASSGGDPLHPAWFKNLESDRRATVITEAGRRGVEAFVAVGHEREAALRRDDRDLRRLRDVSEADDARAAARAAAAAGLNLSRG